MAQSVGIVPPSVPSANCLPAVLANDGYGLVGALTATDYCRAHENVGPLGLPSNYGSLSTAERLFVLANLERVNRGEVPIVGLTSSLDSAAQQGANAQTDPSVGNLDIWAGGQPTLEQAVYDWMYDDGPGGPNAACPGTGCWGHRNAILANDASMGAGWSTNLAAGAATNGTSYAMVFVSRYSGTDYVFTWASELPYFGSAPGIEALPPPSISSIAPNAGSATGGSVVTITGRALSAVSAVVFGSVGATGINCTSDSTCTAIAPKQPMGPVSLYVVNPAGASNRLSYQYVHPPCSVALPAGSVVGMAPTYDGKGYWIASSTGQVSACGDAPTLGNGAAGTAAISGTPDGRGYWLVTTTGAVYSFGSAVYHGGVPGSVHLARPIVAMADDPATGGYWLLGGDGGVFSFDAPFYGSTGNYHLWSPAVGMEATPSGGGYRFVAADGGIFDFGNAGFYGSLGGVRLNKPIVGMAVDPATGGYWLDAADGGIFSFGAPFFGSTGNIALNQPCVGMTSTPDGRGYRFVAADGGIFDFGDAGFYGSAVG